MSGFIHCVDFLTPTGYVTGGAGAAAAGFPHSYAADILHAHRPWKSAANAVPSTTFYGIDFGSAKRLEAVAVDNINGGAFALQADAVNTFDSGSLITMDVVVSANAVERGSVDGAKVDTGGVSIGRLKAFVNLDGTDFDGAARRYWRILCGITTPYDGTSGPMVIGSVAWCRTITTWSSGTSSYAEQPLEATRLNDDYAGGGADPVILGNPYAAITLGSTPGDYSTMRSPLMELLRQGVGRPFLFYRNAGDTSDFYICTRAADVSVRTTSPNTIEFDNFIMRSAV